ncbi:hypothetical protein BJP36_42355 [Moorena producens JHB]|uniref:Uncharacterized protein n=1 Tax=Moorena producens (strain JHB) TaxID=1454205 RepID=A0A9Q9SST0_MOOP1|nr:hypothetical protein [Moorena producens]WAN69009.1 hypothetical protein BJP36_42355 [Moorena producens JHB]
MRYTQLSSPDSLGALTVVELNSPRVAPLPTPIKPGTVYLTQWITAIWLTAQTD